MCIKTKTLGDHKVQPAARSSLPGSIDWEGLGNDDNGGFNERMGDDTEPQDPDSSVRVEILRNYCKLEPERVMQNLKAQQPFTLLLVIAKGERRIWKTSAEGAPDCY